MSAFKICTPPVIAYLVIAIIMFITTFIINTRTSGFQFGSTAGQIMSNICCSILCILILIGLCSVTESPATSWIIVGIMGFYMLSSLSGMSAALVKPVKV